MSFGNFALKIWVGNHLVRKNKQKAEILCESEKGLFMKPLTFLQVNCSLRTCLPNKQQQVSQSTFHHELVTDVIVILGSFLLYIMAPHDKPLHLCLKHETLSWTSIRSPKSSTIYQENLKTKIFIVNHVDEDG